MSSADPPGGPAPDPVPEPSRGRRRVALGGLLVAVVAVAIAAAVALQSDDDGRADDVRAVLTSRLDGIGDDDLDCLAATVVDDLGADGVDALRLDQVTDADRLPRELEASLQVATASCDVSFDPEPDADAGGTETPERPGIDELAEAYRTRYPSISAAQARCLAETDAAVRELSTTPDPAEVLGRIDACGVPRDVLGLETTTVGP